MHTCVRTSPLISTAFMFPLTRKPIKNPATVRFNRHIKVTFALKIFDKPEPSPTTVLNFSLPVTVNVNEPCTVDL